jgi:nucleoside-diphosphate-sugar epimerase
VRLDAAGLLTIEPGPPEDTLVLADVSRLKSEVGWHPPSEITSRLEETIAWWRSAAVAEDVR